MSQEVYRFLLPCAAQSSMLIFQIGINIVGQSEWLLPGGSS